MKIATAAQIRAIDRRAIDEIGIPGPVLMEAAGAAFARACVEELGGSVRGKRIALLCGKGNNGGDGFVAARYLANAGAEVSVFLTVPYEDLKGDAALHFKPLRHMTEIRIVTVTGAVADLEHLDERFDLFGDALLGTGVKGAPTGVSALLVGILMNAANRGVPVIAADIPSGVDADSGRVEEKMAVRATRTVTFALPKPGLLMYPGVEHVGRLTVADIGIPQRVLSDGAHQYELTTLDWMRRTLPKRQQTRDANKGSFGTVLVIAGAAGMAGAAVLTALSALRTGAGLVTLAIPQSLLPIAAMLAPEIILKGLPETREGTHGGPGALDAALALTDKADSIALGPGMGGNTTVASFVQAFVRRAGKPIVIDADGLNALTGSPTAVRNRGETPTVLTPHPGEMGRLLSKDTRAVQADRLEAARQCAETYQCAALLKGSRTLIATPDGRTAFNRKGSVALATAGSGDVLTGVIAALLGQKHSAFDAARLGAYLHAVAGEIAEADLGATGALAGDIRDRLPLARRALYEKDDLDEL
jgi:hydroxyethylthiazole kinase-like uncharacterized protein yjeF